LQIASPQWLHDQKYQSCHAAVACASFIHDAKTVIEFFDDLIEHASYSSFFVHHNLAVRLFSLDRKFCDLASEHLQASLQICDECAESFLLQGLIYKQKNQSKFAEEAFERAFALKPDLERSGSFYYPQNELLLTPK
jgi:hypothetical protein